MTANRQTTSRQTILGAGWLIGSRFVTRGIDFVGLLALARLLVPSDFGVVAMAMTLVQLVEAVLELPVGQVLVRSRSLTAALLSTAFTLGMIRGVFLSFVLIAASWLFAGIYHDQRLIGLISFLSLAPALRGMVSPRMVVFARAIDFRRDVALDLASKVTALAISTATAYFTKSYWAIALGTVCTPLVLVLGSYLLAPYRPRFGLREWRVFLDFLGWSTAAQLITAVNWQSDRPVLGLFIGNSALGQYSLANDLSLLPEQALVKPAYQPLLSGFVSVSHDQQRLASAHLRAAHLIVAAGTPMLVGLSLLAYPATRLVLGGKWSAAAPIVQWLALTLIAPLFTAAMPPLAVALGRTQVFFFQSIIELLVRLPLTVVLAWKFGIVGMLIARLLTGLLNTGTSMYFVKRLIQVSLARQLTVGWRPALGAVVMVIVLLFTRPVLQGSSGFALFASLTAVAGSGLVAYAATYVGLWFASGRPQGIEASVLARIQRRGPGSDPHQAKRNE